MGNLALLETSQIIDVEWSLISKGNFNFDFTYNLSYKYHDNQN